jgi:hypothetical protein
MSHRPRTATARITAPAFAFAQMTVMCNSTARYRHDERIVIHNEGAGRQVQVPVTDERAVGD